MWDGFFAFLLGVAGALLGSQGPEFTVQYMQNLQGRVDELRPLVEQFDADLAKYNYTRRQALRECKSATQLLAALCDGYETSVRRYELLSAHLAELNTADEFVRPLILGKTQMRDITLSVYEQFKPAVPVTLIGGTYAAGGFAVLWGSASFLFGILGWMFGSGRRYA